MTAKYKIIESDEFSGATIYLGGDTYSIDSTHPAWNEIVDFLRARTDDDEALSNLIHPVKEVSQRLTKLSERVTVGAGTIYFDGDVLDNSLADHIVRLVEGGKDDKESGYPAFVRFLEKLYTNPSKKSRKHLYHFIENHSITIHPDGDFIAYKGVKADGTSINRGYGIVDGEVFTNAALPNRVGSVVEIPRSMVDDDRDVACSTGLHAGTFGYASSFAQGQLLTVKINPRDVVSVPSDSYNAKLRVSRYEVLEINTHEYVSPTFEDDYYGDDGDFEDDSELAEDEDDAPTEQDTYSDDELADAISATGNAKVTEDADGSSTIVVTINVKPAGAARDSKGRYLPGDANPGKKHPRDSKGRYLPKDGQGQFLPTHY